MKPETDSRNLLIGNHLAGANVFGAVAVTALVASAIAAGSAAGQAGAVAAAAFAYLSQMFGANAVYFISGKMEALQWGAILLAVVAWCAGFAYTFWI